MKLFAVLVILVATGASVAIQAPPARRGPRLVAINLRGVNTTNNEDDPYLVVSRDGKTRRLYYTSDAPGRPSLYLAEADSTGEWRPGQLVEGPDSDAANMSPCLTLDGHDLYYATRLTVREGDASASNFDIVHSIHVDKGLRFTGPTPLQSIATEADEVHPWLTAEGKLLYFSRKTKEGWQVYVAERAAAAGAFTEFKPVSEIPLGYSHATITADGTTMFLQGPLPGNRSGLFRSKRSRSIDRKWKPWSTPEALDILNASAEEAPQGDMSPNLSRDDRRLYFASDRKGGKGGRDIWMVGAGNVISGVFAVTPKK